MVYTLEQGLAIIESRGKTETKCAERQHTSRHSAHGRAIDKLLVEISGAKDAGFKRALCKPLGNWHHFTIIPDLYSIEGRIVTAYEVEDRCPIPPYKMLEYCRIFSALLLKEWEFKLIVCSQWADDLHEIDMLKRCQNVLRAKEIEPRRYVRTRSY